MNTMEIWMQSIISIISGLVVAIPLVFKLVEYVKKAVKEKNWNQLLKLVMSYMAEAEKKFEDGASRKEWVMAMVQNSAEIVNYDADMEVISDLVDSLCAMSKVVNAPTK